MVGKIQEKKAALGASGSEEGDPLSPFTPHNSYVEMNFPTAYAKETQLPSFHSSDMVERIREKRSSMERDMLGTAEGERADSDTLLDAMKSPFTPHNSFVEGSFDQYARENLPSLNNAETANKIRQRQAELTAAAGSGGGEASAGDNSPMGGTESSLSPAAPYTPQNSYRDSHLESLSLDDLHRTDLNEVAERLSLTGSESAESLKEPKAVMASNKVHGQGSVEQEGESFDGDGGEESSEVSPSVEEEMDRGENGDASTASMGVKRKGVSFLPEGEEDEEQQDEEEEANSAISEEAIQKIAYELANEMIQKALETFPSESVKELVPSDVGGAEMKRPTHQSISEDSSPTMDESDKEFSPFDSPKQNLSHDNLKPSPDRETLDSALASSTESEQLVAQFSQPAMKTSSSLADELAQALSSSVSDNSAEPSQSESGVPKSESYEIETEYLSDMDPMQMGVFHPDATNVIETDADKEVVEGASFRKISGQEYQTVQVSCLSQDRLVGLAVKASKSGRSWFGSHFCHGSLSRLSMPAT